MSVAGEERGIKKEIKALKKTISNWKRMQKATMLTVNNAESLDDVKTAILGSIDCPLCEFYGDCSVGCPLFNRITTDQCDHGNRYATVNDLLMDGKPVSRYAWNLLCKWLIGRCEARIKKLSKKGAE